MPATFTAKFNFGYGWFLGEDPGTEPLDYQTKALDALVLDAFGQDIATTGGLTYGYRGGWVYHTGTKLPVKAIGGTIILQANYTSYIERDENNVVYASASFTANRIPMAIAITNNFEIVSVEDARVVNGSYPNLVRSVFGRTGHIAPMNGDYSANLVSVSPLLVHYSSALNVQQALELMDTDITLALAQGVKTFGPVGGPARTGNVFTQYGDYNADLVSVVDAIAGIDLSGFTSPSVQDALGVLSAKSGVSSFNLRFGAVTPVSGDYPAGLIPYNDAVPTEPLLPNGVVVGNQVQSALDAFKQHFHDATQIVMNPVIVAGKDTVQKMLQWLYDTRGTTSSLVTNTVDFSTTGPGPFDFNISLVVSGGTPPYVWTFVDAPLITTGTGKPANSSVITPDGGGVSHFAMTGVALGTYTANFSVHDSTPGTPLTGTDSVTITLASGVAPAIISSFYASSSTVTSGQPFDLIWAVSGYDSLSIDNGVGGVNLSPKNLAAGISSPTTFTLTAVKAGAANATAQTTVNVSGAPQISSFTNSGPLPVGGGAVDLNWTASNYTTLTINQGVGVVTGSTKHLNSVTVSTTYTLTASKVGYPDATATTTVTVSLVNPLTLTTPAIPMYGVTNYVTGNSGTVSDATSVPNPGSPYSCYKFFGSQQWSKAGGTVGGAFVWTLGDGSTGPVGTDPNDRLDASTALGTTWVSVTTNGVLTITTPTGNVPAQQHIHTNKAYWLQAVCSDIGAGTNVKQVVPVSYKLLNFSVSPVASSTLEYDSTGSGKLVFNVNPTNVANNDWHVSNAATGPASSETRSVNAFASDYSGNSSVNGSYVGVTYNDMSDYFEGDILVDLSIIDNSTGLIKTIKDYAVAVAAERATWDTQIWKSQVQLEASATHQAWNTFSLDLATCLGNHGYPGYAVRGIGPFTYSVVLDAPNSNISWNLTGSVLTIYGNNETTASFTIDVRDALNRQPLYFSSYLSLTVNPEFTITTSSTQGPFDTATGFDDISRNLTLAASGGNQVQYYMWTIQNADINYGTAGGSFNSGTSIVDHYNSGNASEVVPYTMNFTSTPSVGATDTMTVSVHCKNSPGWWGGYQAAQRTITKTVTCTIRKGA